MLSVLANDFGADDLHRLMRDGVTTLNPDCVLRETMGVEHEVENTEMKRNFISNCSFLPSEMISQLASFIGSSLELQKVDEPQARMNASSGNMSTGCIINC